MKVFKRNQKIIIDNNIYIKITDKKKNLKKMFVMKYEVGKLNRS